MIRINLFPVRQARQRERGKQQLAIGVGILSVVTAAIVVYHGYETAENAQIELRNKQLTESIDKLKKEIGDYEQVKTQRAELLKQKETLLKLQSNRAGPVYLMREVADILSQGKGPTLDKVEYDETLRRDPNAGFNPNWDVRRVWLTAWEEKNHIVTLRGQAKSADDAAEFAKRMKLSPFFLEVYLQQIQAQADTKNNVSFVTFDIKCRVNY